MVNELNNVQQWLSVLVAFSRVLTIQLPPANLSLVVYRPRCESVPRRGRGKNQMERLVRRLRD
jgi:hypothetical protein